MTWDLPISEKCPQCGATLFKKTGRQGKIYCAKEGCGYERPLDKKMRAIDSVALQRQIQKEKMEYPGFALYPNWTNERVHVYGNVAMPDSFTIDLKGFCMPTDNRKITSKYGPRRRRMHKGVDVKVYIGDTIRSAFDGKVRVVQYERRGYGKYVVIRHDNGLETIYGHLSKQLVGENQIVKAGEPIGLGGNTGRSTGSHLHFETRFLGQDIDPTRMFDFPNQDIVADTYTYYKPGSRKGSKTEGSNSSSEIRYYRVRKGDTLSKIAARQGVSVRRLCQLNGITTRTTLRIGQVLRFS